MSGSSFRQDLSDVFRLFLYGKRVRLNYSGTPYPIEQGGHCSTYCPVGMADFTYGSERSYFTVVGGFQQWPEPTIQRNMKGYTFNSYVDDGAIHLTPLSKAQAIRTLGYDANQVFFGAALATAQNNLTLSMFNTKAGGCP